MRAGEARSSSAFAGDRVGKVPVVWRYGDSSPSSPLPVAVFINALIMSELAAVLNRSDGVVFLLGSPVGE